MRNSCEPIDSIDIATKQRNSKPTNILSGNVTMVTKWTQDGNTVKYSHLFSVKCREVADKTLRNLLVDMLI